MNLNERIKVFEVLGKFLCQFINDGRVNQSLNTLNNKFYKSFEEAITNSHIFNPWFTENNVRESIHAITQLITKKNLTKWLNNYDLKIKSVKKIGVVLAGNIPLVGFHDFLSVIITGHVFIGKLSSKDDKLFPLIKSIILEIRKELKDFIHFTLNKLENYDAVIATGSNNSARYFNYYFGKYPHIIRKNRNGIAVLTGKESKTELENLGKDIFQYFGLGCRNVSKLLVPENYNFTAFFQAIENNNYLYNHNKYANNVDYNRSVYLMNRAPFLDNGFLLLKEDLTIASPIGVVYYSYYKSHDDIIKYIKDNSEKIQCILTKDSLIKNKIPFGKSQYPELFDYADEIDTIEFLANL